MHLTRKRLGLGLAVLAILALGYSWLGGKEPSSGGASRQAAGNGRPPAAVLVDKVSRGPMPVRIDAIGSVQPIANVALKTRADAQIESILVDDGAMVKADDVLVKLDSRQIEAQIRQTEATIAKDLATVEQSQRDLARLSDLFARGSGAQINVDNAATALATAKANLAADQALLENQKVQLTWYTIRAPIAGRVGTFTQKAGNIIRAGDNSATGVIATIVQTSPIYVAFSVPQALLPDVRQALADGTAETLATPQGGRKAAKGKVSVLDNTIDITTGTVTARALFENADEILWPGQLCNVSITLRVEPETVSIPRTATQSSQNGQFVYIIENNVAHIRPIKVSRFQDDRDVVVEGLNGGETIVVDGALLLTDGAKVNIRNAQDNDSTKKGAS
jgi:membrane fusion protein, multidrug efflux system